MKKLAILLPYALILSPLALSPACGDDGGGDDTSSTASNSGGTLTTGSTGTTGTVSGTNTTDTDTGTDSTNPPTCANITDPATNLEPTNDGDFTLTCDKVWRLTGHTYWNSGTLTIQPGTQIIGVPGSSLVINKGAKIHAAGTAAQPIVLTSSALNMGAQPARSDWGGLVLVGQAVTNVGVGLVEGFPDPIEYGGSDATHNCGTLQYLRVEWAGSELTPGSEINGITFYACGSATKADHIQVHMGSDDGIEFFGGGFDLKYLLLTGNDDDSLDIDQGFTGKIQYVVAQHGAGSGDYALEWSNQAMDFTKAPLTNPMIANATLIGSDGAKSKGWTNKEGNQGHVYCSIFTKFPNESLYLTNIETENQLKAGAIELKNSLFFGNGTPFAKTCKEVKPEDCNVTMSGSDLEAWARTAAFANTFDADPLLGNTGWGTLDAKPAATSPVIGKCSGLAAGFDAVTYVGAVDPADPNPWTAAAWINHAGN